MKAKRWFVGVIVLGLLGTASITARGADVFCRLLKEIPIGGDGGWDYLSVDASARRLYVTHAGKVVVIDLLKDEVSGEITNTPGVHGFAVSPELGRG